MEKVICNKNLALCVKAPPYLSKAYKGSEVDRAGEGPRHLQQQMKHFLFLFLTGGGQRILEELHPTLSGGLAAGEPSTQVLSSTDLLSPGQTLRLVMGVSFSSSCSITSLLSLRSSLVSTRMIGVLGQWCRTSGTTVLEHFQMMKDSGEKSKL